MIDGEQMTIIWHVDDLKFPHKNPWEVTKFAIWLSSIYGEIKVQQGKILNYLGMTLDYTKPGKVQISMIPYIEKMLEYFPERIKDTGITLAADHLFTIRTDLDSKKLQRNKL